MKVILDYLAKSKDEDTLLSLIRLLLALTATSQPISHALCDDTPLLSHLFSLLRACPHSAHPSLCAFSPRLLLYLLSLLRALLHHTPSPKHRLLSDPHLPAYLTNTLLPLYYTTATTSSDEELSSTLLSLLTAILRDEPEYKRVVGPAIVNALCEEADRCDIRGLKCLVVVITRCRENVEIVREHAGGVRDRLAKRVKGERDREVRDKCKQIIEIID